MGLNKLLLYRVLSKNRKLGLLFVGYKAAKFMFGLYQKRNTGTRKVVGKKRI